MNDNLLRGGGRSSVIDHYESNHAMISDLSGEHNVQAKDANVHLS